MKNLLTILMTFLVIATAESQTRQKNISDTRLDRVTLFTNGAQVFRQSNTLLESGKTELTFKGLPMSLNPQSLQVRGEGDFTVLSVTHRLNHLDEVEKKDSARLLEQKRDQLNDQIISLSNQLMVLISEETLLQKNNIQLLGVSNSTLKLEDLKQTADYQRERMTDIYAKRAKINKDLDKVRTELTPVTMQIYEMSAVKRTSTSEIVVVVNAKNSVSAKFELNYLVPNASWFPNYDLRVTDITSPIKLTMRANVSQNTGEDWRDVKLTLSTANPTESGSRPVLSPWRLAIRQILPQRDLSTISGSVAGVAMGNADLNFKRNSSFNRVTGLVRDANGEALVGAAVMVVGTRNGTITDMEGRFALDLRPNDHVLSVSYIGFNTKTMPIAYSDLMIVMNENSQTLSDVVVTSYAKPRKKKTEALTKISAEEISSQPVGLNEKVNTTNVSYEIELPYTIVSDGKQNTVEIRDISLPASYQYYAAPKVEAAAFLTAQVKDWEQYNLLSGEANLYMEGTYIGKTFLDANSTNDTLNISLGRDKNVVVTRTKLKEYSKSNYFSSSKNDSRAFEIVVKNKKNQPINLMLEDQVPISTTKEIEVQQNVEAGELDALTGKIRWILNVASQKESRVKFDYKVTYPKSQRINLD